MLHDLSARDEWLIAEALFVASRTLDVAEGGRHAEADAMNRLLQRCNPLASAVLEYQDILRRALLTGLPTPIPGGAMPSLDDLTAWLAELPVVSAR